MQLAGAVLDVTLPEPLPEDSPLWTHPKIRIFPHRATAASEGVEETVKCCISIRQVPKQPETARLGWRFLVPACMSGQGAAAARCWLP